MFQKVFHWIMCKGYMSQRKKEKYKLADCEFKDKRTYYKERNGNTALCSCVYAPPTFHDKDIIRMCMSSDIAGPFWQQMTVEEAWLQIYALREAIDSLSKKVAV